MTTVDVRHENHLIDGRRTPSASSESLPVVDPTTGDVAAYIPAGCDADVDAAVAAAARAQVPWSRRPVAERARIVAEAGHRLASQMDRLVELASADLGQPLTLTRRSLRGLEAAFSSFDELDESFFCRELTGPDGVRGLVRRQPYGVVAQIVPWNFPVVMALQYLPVLLVAGNTVVLKPSELTPLGTLAAIELTGLPAGLVNVVLGDARAARPLVEHPAVGFVFHTGSVATGRAVAAACGSGLKPALLELGGKDPVLVDAGVDPQWAAEQVAVGAFANTGQWCVSMERIYVHQDIAAPFTDALVAAARAHVPGPPSDPAATLGPMASERQRALVQSHVDDAVSRGARVLTGGAPIAGPGTYYPATVVVDVPDDSRLMIEETFGPVASIRVVDSFDEGLRLAANSEFGLGATCLTPDRTHAEQFVRDVPAAIHWVNEWGGYLPGFAMEPANSSGVGAIGDDDTMLTAVTTVRSAYLAPLPLPTQPAPQ